MEKPEYFWECKNLFSRFLATKCFPNTYKRKFSLVGDGIYDLVILPKFHKIFEIKMVEAKALPQNPDGKLTNNQLKNKVIQQICNKTKRENYIVDKGCIYVNLLDKWYGKIQVIEKRAMPE